ncbi:MAG: hypothetical protein KDD47_14775, partial [Acidobacteria bacterium]|nr:hypothetical protein [Acidobacteriota bacterium]
MSSSDTARSSIHLRSLNGPAQLRLLDHRMSPVAEGYGELQKGNLDPGLYLLEIDAGSHHEERILSLKAGEPYQDLQLDVAFPSAAPVEGTSTSHEYHAYPARDLSRQPNLKWGDGGRLMLFVRNLGGEMDRPIDFGALSLVDQGLAPLGG